MCLGRAYVIHRDTRVQKAMQLLSRNDVVDFGQGVANESPEEIIFDGVNLPDENIFFVVESPTIARSVHDLLRAQGIRENRFFRSTVTVNYSEELSSADIAIQLMQKLICYITTYGYARKANTF